MSNRFAWTGFVLRDRRLAVAGFLMLLVAGMMGSGGCSAKNPYQAGTYDRGVFFAEHGKNLQAVAAFESFVRHNPVDSLAAEAQYRKALTYMDMKEYPLASVEFQIMRKDYPTSPFVEDALFEEGKAYLFQVGRVERDLTGAYEARLHFLQFSQEYPGSKYMPEVVQYMQEISDLMVLKRIEQVKVYAQLKRYAAIAIVLDDVMVDEAGSTLIPDVMWRRAKIAQQLDDPDTEARMYENLIGFGEGTDFYGKATSALKQINEKNTDEQ